MARALPGARMRFGKSGVGVVVPPDNVVAFLGCCTKGPTLDPYRFSSPDTLASGRGAGPGLKGAVYSLARTGAPLIFSRLPATARAAYTSPVDTDEIDGTAEPTVTGTPLDGFDVVVTIVNGGTIGTTGITYTVSLNGGGTTAASAALGTATSIVLTGTGLTVNLTSAQTFSAGDVFRFYTLPGSAAILKQTTTRAEDPPSTSALTLSGTPVDAYEVRFEIRFGGTVGTKGIVYRYSLDGGRTWSRDRALGTASSVALLDGAESSGLTLGFGAGTLDTGDRHEAKTTAPEPSAADVVEALTRLRASSHRWSFAAVIMEATVEDAQTIAAYLTDLAEDANGNELYKFACLSARDRTAAEDDAAWSARLVEDYAEFDADRLAIGAGHARVTCPITRRRNRRPVMFVVVPKIIQSEIEEDPGKRANGAMPEDVTISERNLPAEHDARLNDALHVAGFVTLTSRQTRDGIFVTRGNIFTEEDAAVDRIPRRRVLDKCAEVGRQALEDLLESNFIPNPDGTLLENEAADIDLDIENAIAGELGDAVVGVRVRVSRTDPVALTSRASAEITVFGLGYIDQFDAVIRYNNPRLTAAQSDADAAE